MGRPKTKTAFLKKQFLFGQAHKSLSNLFNKNAKSKERFAG